MIHIVSRAEFSAFGAFVCKFRKIRLDRIRKFAIITEALEKLDMRE